MKNAAKKLITLVLTLIVTVGCGSLLIGCDGEERKAKYSHEEIAATYSSYAVEISSGDKEGTGIILKADGTEAIIATCYHVTGYDASAVKIRFAGDEKPINYEIATIGYDKRFDLAFFKVSNAFTSREIDFLSGERVFGDESILPLGRAVTVLGNAFGSGISVFDGIVSLPETVELIEGYCKPLTRITAAVNPGSSGAPVFDDEGNLIGIGQGIDTSCEDASYILPSSVMLTLAKKAVSNPKNGDIERADVRFEKSDERIDGSYALAKITTGGDTYYYSTGKLTLNGAKVVLSCGEKKSATLSGVTSALINA